MQTDDLMSGSDSSSIGLKSAETLRSAMIGFQPNHGLNSTDAIDAPFWFLGDGLLKIRIPNFAWRKHAIAKHDIHHLLTGYPCTPFGEMQMAAWEFAAGRFPHPGATAFCLPLVAMGAFLCPKRTFSAFVRGRCSTSLYALPLTDELLASKVVELRERFAPETPVRPTFADRMSFLMLSSLSCALVIVPPVLVVWAVVAILR
jgi:hypothetical protein